MVDEQVARYRRQVGARLAQDQGPLLRLGRQHAHERVLRQVGRVIGATQLAPQPSQKPGMVVPVERGYVGCGVGELGQDAVGVLFENENYC